MKMGFSARNPIASFRLLNCCLKKVSLVLEGEFLLKLLKLVAQCYVKGFLQFAQARTRSHLFHQKFLMYFCGPHLKPPNLFPHTCVGEIFLKVYFDLFDIF